MIKKCLFGSSFLTLAIALSSCSPVYIPDPIDPRLPKYTEEGNDVGGALINGSLWKAEYFHGLFSSIQEPLLLHNSDRDSLSITFDGMIGESNRAISFGLVGYKISSLAEMIKLEGLIISFDGLTKVASLDRLAAEICPTTATGQIYFRSVKCNLENDNLTISGTFGFNYDDPVCGKIAVTNGRFDFSVFSFYPM